MLAGHSRFDVVFTDEWYLQAGLDYDTKWRPSNDRSGPVNLALRTSQSGPIPGTDA